MQRLIELTHVQTIPTLSKQNPIAAGVSSGPQVASFGQALDEQVNELGNGVLKNGELNNGGLNDAVRDSASETSADPRTDLSARNNVREDPFLPSPTRFKPMPGLPDGSVFTPDGLSALPQIQAIPSNGKESAADPVKTTGKDTPVNSSGSRSNGTQIGSASPSSAGSRSAAAQGLTEVADLFLLLTRGFPAAAGVVQSAVGVAEPGRVTGTQTPELTKGIGTPGEDKIDPDKIGGGAQDESSTLDGAASRASDTRAAASLRARSGETVPSATMPASVAEPRQGVADGLEDAGKAARLGDDSPTDSVAAAARGVVTAPVTGPSSGHAQPGTRSLADVQAAQSGHAPANPGASLLPAQSQPAAAPHVAGFEGSSSSNAAHLEHAAAESSGPAGNPYQKMDQISAAPAAVISSGGNRVAVGLHDPALGWVEIKTQSTAGQIAAALVTSSSQTHQTLTAQLPSLAQFLSDRDVKVNSVAVQQQATGGNNSGQAGSGEEQGSNAQPGNGGTSSGFNAHSTLTAAGLGADEVFEERPLSYISVRA